MPFVLHLLHSILLLSLLLVGCDELGNTLEFGTPTPGVVDIEIFDAGLLIVCDKPNRQVCFEFSEAPDYDFCAPFDDMPAMKQSACYWMKRSLRR
jgi:hypothetical protein